MLDSRLKDLYDNGLDLAHWYKENIPDEQLLYRNGLTQQIHKIAAVGSILPDDVYARVVGDHTSKSVKLPVSCFRFRPPEAYAFIRDNFHDIKVVVVSDAPIHMPYHVVHTEWSPERYEEEIKRYGRYHENDTAEEAQQRRALMATDDWYKDWSSGVILRKNGHIYRAGSYQDVYCEGVNKLGLHRDTFKPYEDGDQGFVCEVGSYVTVALILEHVIRSLAQAGRSEEV
jgi:phenylalanine-4-hydroxylase